MCAPPLKIDVQPSGQTELICGYKTGPGDSCVRGKLSRAPSAARFRRDGFQHKLDRLVDINGNGVCYVGGRLDGAFQLDGTCQLPQGKGYFDSEFFCFKHGVNSWRMFDYVLTSRDMRVKKVRDRR